MFKQNQNTVIVMAFVGLSVYMLSQNSGLWWISVLIAFIAAMAGTHTGPLDTD